MRARWHRLLGHKRILVAIVVVVLAGVGSGTWLVTRSAAAPTSTTQIVTASLGTIQQTTSASGTIEPANQSNVDFAVSGQVTAVDVSVGQTVTKGQKLATVDPTALQAALASAQATLESDQSRQSSDSASGASTSQLDADNAAVTAAQSAVTSAQDSLDAATLTAPIAGTVAEVNLSIGQQVSGGASSSGSSGSQGNGSNGSSSLGGGGPGASSSSSSSSSSTNSSSTQIVIVDTGSWQVDASVDDSAIGQIQKGDQAQIVPQGSSTTVYGTVGSIGLIASQSSGVASFPVVIDVTGDPSGLYSGMTANVSIVVKELTNVLEVPTAALRFSGGSVEVEKVVNGQHVMQPVTVGITSGGEAQITQGLAAGDQVVETLVRQTGGTGRTGTGGGLGGGLGGGGFPGGGLGGGGLGGGGLGGGGFPAGPGG